MLLWLKEVFSGFGFVEWCILFEECVPSLGCHSILIPGSSAFFSCALLVNVMGHLFLATVFYNANAFNGDLNQWDVAKVTTMSYRKSIRIVENDLTWRELKLLRLGGSVGVLGLVVMNGLLSSDCHSILIRVLPPTFSCDSVSWGFRLQRRPQSLGCFGSYQYAWT